MELRLSLPPASPDPFSGREPDAPAAGPTLRLAGSDAVASIVVASPEAAAELDAALHGLGFSVEPVDDPYAAVARLARRPAQYGAVILSLAGVYDAELSLIGVIKRRFPHVEVVIAHTDGRAGALADALRLGADALLQDARLYPLGRREASAARDAGRPSPMIAPPAAPAVAPPPSPSPRSTVPLTEVELDALDDDGVPPGELDTPHLPAAPPPVGLVGEAHDGPVPLSMLPTLHPRHRESGESGTFEPRPEMVRRAHDPVLTSEELRALLQDP